jgi:hypothetical protein
VIEGAAVVRTAGTPVEVREAPPAAVDRIAPGVKLGARLHARKRRFLRRGLPVTLHIDEPSGVRVRLDVPANRRGLRVPIARAEPKVAVNGRVVLRLRPVKGAAKRLRRRRRTHARLTVVVTDRAGNTRIVRRRVTIA